MDQDQLREQYSKTVSDVLRLSRDKTVSDVLRPDSYRIVTRTVRSRPALHKIAFHTSESCFFQVQAFLNNLLQPIFDV